MNAPPMPRLAPARDPVPRLMLCGASLAIVAATVAAYGWSLRGPFLYDDVDSILGNASLRHISTAFQPPPGATVSGRPVLNLSFALNYAVSGTATWSYHALNVAIHALSALLLFEIVRRTLAFPAAGYRSARECVAVAFAAALLWALHPLQTESVAYVVQRAESLMGFFYLLTLYAFIRSTDPVPGAPLWGPASVAACLLGMGTKEVMATAPLIVLLYDRTFVAGSFRGAWRLRWSLYLALGACWIPLALLVAQAGGRDGSAGFGSGVPWWDYLATQMTAIVYYLRLSFWPHPLVGDYGRILEGSPVDVAACAAVVSALAAGTLVLVRRRPAAGFLGAWFLVILAPSSSVIPVSTEIMAEHRMYLPLAAVATAVAVALRRMLGRRAFLATAGVAALGLAVLTVRRTHVYDSSLTFWSDVVRKVPANAGAWNNLGLVRAGQGDNDGAIDDFSRALALAPKYAYAHYNLGNSLLAKGRARDAAGEYEAALPFHPQDPSIHLRFGDALAASGRPLPAAAEFRAVLKLDPGRADAWLKLGDAMEQAGNTAQAAEAYGNAVRLHPGLGDARVNYGNALAQLGRYPAAVGQLKAALRLEPGAADIHNNLGSVLARSGDLAGARSEFEEAVRLKPDYHEAQDNLARVRALLQSP